jgi:chaperone required for assembly of F1-ATPase
MKRFWTDVTVAEADGHYAIMLDGKPMRLPGGPALRLQSAVLAAAIADEWAEAGGEIGGEVSLDALSLTRLAGTAQARIAPDTAPVAEALAAYAQTDLLCYRVEVPEGLAERQQVVWQPWLDWAALRYQARLLTSVGVMHVAQPVAALAAFGQAVGGLDAFALAGLGIIVPAFGSLVLGLAVLEGEITPEAAYEVSILDDLFQEGIWGMDRDAVARRVLMQRDVEAAARFVALSHA